MKVSICITTYYRNESLEKCINSINEIKLKKNNKINIIIVDNTPNNNLDKIKKKLVKNSKYKITFLNEKKRGRVFARNRQTRWCSSEVVSPDSDQQPCVSRVCASCRTRSGWSWIQRIRFLASAEHSNLANFEASRVNFNVLNRRPHELSR